MAHIEARNVVLLIDNGTDFVPEVCALNFSLKTTTETKEIMTVGDGNWTKPKAQKKGYSMSFESVTRYPRDINTGYDAFDLLSHQMGDTNFRYKVMFYENDGSTVVKMITGEALVIDSDLGATAEQIHQNGFSCVGFGAYEVFDTAVACNAVLASVFYSAQSPLFVDIGYTGLIGGDTIIYSVDGSTIRTLAAMPQNGTITIINGVGMTPGLHTIEVWPVCDNGERGTSLLTNFTKT